MKKKRRRFLKLILILLISALILDIGYWLIRVDISGLRRGNPGKTAFMEYTEMQWQKQGRKLRINQIYVPLQAISNYLVTAVVIAEDDKFWSHEGFDFEAIEKAIERDIKEKKFKVGGSTITQQLAKNLYLSPSKNPLRKLNEAVIAWRLERGLKKRRILEIYLNVAEWGEGTFGAEAASRRYFGKPASALTPEEAARLASVLPSPKRYSPVRPSRYVDSRSRFIYDIMMKRGVVAGIDEEE